MEKLLWCNELRPMHVPMKPSSDFGYIRPLDLESKGDDTSSKKGAAPSFPVIQSIAESDDLFIG
jgi:hypothetical protein